MNKTYRGFCPSQWTEPQGRIWSKISKLIMISIKYYFNHHITKLEGVVNTVAC